MQEILDENSGFNKHTPEIVFTNVKLDPISPTLVNHFFSLSNSDITVEIDNVVNYYEQIIRAIRSRSGAVVVINTFEPPSYPTLGVLDYQSCYRHINTIRDLNSRILKLCNQFENTFILDFELLVSRIGYHAFFDNRHWHMARAPYSREAMRLIAVECAKFISALKGKSIKCIVVDCDNTLWGGIVGEDGFNGISIGKNYPGSTYLEFQQLLLNFQDRGIILAINSKNNENDVLEVLKKHPGMILREEDFAIIVANWEDKASNLMHISEELNIGLENMVFVDDNPFEIDLVKQMLPQVEAILLPKEPSGFKFIFDDQGYFDSLQYSEEDKNRGKMYQTEIKRKENRQRYSDLNEFLNSLELSVEISFADETTIPRVAQLTQKTNQFNLTTTRYSENDISSFRKSEQNEVVTLSVKDRFGEYGLVGVAIIEFKKNQATLDTFLLSCRVIGRGIEETLLDLCINICRKKNIKTLFGIYIKTAKNNQVKDFYKGRGFSAYQSNESRSEYSIDLATCEHKAPHYIKLTNNC